jgi:hypothetical protein
MVSPILEEELRELPRRLGAVLDAELITCHHSMVQIKVRLVQEAAWREETGCILNISSRKSAHKQITACMQFPAGYPDCRVLLELKSKTIPDKLLEKLVSVCDQEADKCLRKKQVWGGWEEWDGGEGRGGRGGWRR